MIAFKNKLYYTKKLVFKVYFYRRILLRWNRFFVQIIAKHKWIFVDVIFYLRLVKKKIFLGGGEMFQRIELHVRNVKMNYLRVC